LREQEGKGGTRAGGDGRRSLIPTRLRSKTGGRNEREKKVGQTKGKAQVVGPGDWVFAARALKKKRTARGFVRERDGVDGQVRKLKILANGERA